jgi:hypothetical protein
MNKDEKRLEIIRRLARKTHNKELPWLESVRDNAYTVSFAEYSVSIEPESHSTILRIYNKSGQVIDTIRPSHFSDDSDSLEASGLLESMYAEAREKALGIEEVPDDLIELLGDNYSVSTHVGVE